MKSSLTSKFTWPESSTRMGRVAVISPANVNLVTKRGWHHPSSYRHASCTKNSTLSHHFCLRATHACHALMVQHIQELSTSMAGLDKVSVRCDTNPSLVGHPVPRFCRMRLDKASSAAKVSAATIVAVWFAPRFRAHGCANRSASSRYEVGLLIALARSAGHSTLSDLGLRQSDDQ